MRTVTVTEWVPEQYQATRTVCKQEAVQETYTAYRTECVAQQQTHQVTVYKSVAETHNETRTVCRCVPTVEERTVTRQVVTCVPETTYTHKCVDNGHWECREVACGPTLMERLHKLCHRSCDSGCGCDSGCQNECEAPRTRTERVWVSCKQDVRALHPHGPSRRVRADRRARHLLQEHLGAGVGPGDLLPLRAGVVSQTCTVMVPHQVAYQATRTVCHSVPVQETYTACRMVAKTVEKQVPCEAAATTTCGCESECGCEHGRRGWHMGERMGGLFHREKGCESCGCESGCGCH